MATLAELVNDRRWERMAERRLRRPELVTFVRECLAACATHAQLREVGLLLKEVADVIYAGVLKELRSYYAERLLRLDTEDAVRRHEADRDPAADPSPSPMESHEDRTNPKAPPSLGRTFLWPLGATA
jgi:hypothetical protein